MMKQRARSLEHGARGGASLGSRQFSVSRLDSTSDVARLNYSDASSVCPRLFSSPLPAPRSLLRKAGGFTLVELLVVIAIIAILAGLTLAAMGGIQKKNLRSRAMAEVQALSSAIEIYRLEMGFYPTSNNLYTELTGQGPTNTNKVYFEPGVGITTNPLTGPFLDPTGTPYHYEPENPTYNTTSFDLWTTCGGGERDIIRN